MTVTPFLPTASSIFQFQATLDGQPYTVAVLWNTFGQRWYFQITDQNGNIILFRSLVGSPAPIPILTAFWVPSAVTINTQTPHGFPIGTTQNVTIAGLSPGGYNGQVYALITAQSTMTYPLARNPGAAMVTGGVSVVQPYRVSLVGGYFNSTMFFDETLQQFTVSP